MNERNENIEGTAETQACDLGVKTKVILTKNAGFFWAGLFSSSAVYCEEGTIHAASKKMGMVLFQMLEASESCGGTDGFYLS